jgi:Protein of unknown function (DUF3105)
VFVATLIELPRLRVVIATWIVVIASVSAGCADDSTPAPQAGTGGGTAGLAAGSGGAAGAAGAQPTPCTSCGGCPEELPVAGFTHVTGPIDYPDPPPASGDHDACWAKWGVHTDTVPARNWVHNLEHGGVVFLYDCPQGCDTELAMFVDLAKANQRTLVTAYPGLRTRFALVAWAHRLLSDCIDLPAFAVFYAANFNHGREAISSDPPASCE